MLGRIGTKGHIALKCRLFCHTWHDTTPDKNTGGKEARLQRTVF